MKPNLTYRKLKRILDNATDEQLDADVTIFVGLQEIDGEGKVEQFLGGDEFYGASEVKETTKNDENADGVLDDGHLYIVVGICP